MGSASSKATRSAPRKFPLRPADAAVTRATPTKARSGPTSRQDDPETTSTQTEPLDPDAVTGGFSQRLQQMGIVQPNPTYSPSSTSNIEPRPNFPGTSIAQTDLPYPPARNNPTLSALEARSRLQQLAEADFRSMGQTNRKSRRFLDMRTLIDALRLRDQGVSVQEIEQRLGLEARLLDKLGQEDVLRHVTPN